MSQLPATEIRAILKQRHFKTAILFLDDDGSIIQKEFWDRPFRDILIEHTATVLRAAVVSNAENLVVIQENEKLFFSDQDYYLTEWLFDALSLLDIKLSDHCIIDRSTENYISARDLGLIE